jgi:hypothetical protein
MQQTNFLADTFEPESFVFQKPQKYKNAEIMASKIKNRYNEPVIVQFPKMNVVEYNKTLELEFTSETGYNKKVKKFLSSLDNFIVGYISTQSEKWFGKTIPIENVKNMYKPCDSDNKVKFVTTSKSELINKREETVDTSEIVKGVIVESICHLKYLIFTKDSCFLHWEICTSKVHKKIQRVPLFGFIEDLDDHSDNDELSDDFITFW